MKNRFLWTGLFALAASGLAWAKAPSDLSAVLAGHTPGALTATPTGNLTATGNSTVAAGNTTATEPRVPHAPPKPGELRVMEIKELGNFDFDPKVGGGIPPDVTALSGMKVRLRGYMAPLEQGNKISEFALVPSLFSCCFGQPPEVKHTIVCTTVKGMTVPYYPDEVDVTGTLKVDEKKDEGFVVSIFELKVTQVVADKDATKK